MKKLNKILASTMALPALGAIAPALTVTSCAEEKPHLSFDGDKVITLEKGVREFTLKLNGTQHLRTTDNIETTVEVTDLAAAKGSTVTLTYDVEESAKNDGKFAIFSGLIEKPDGSAPEPQTVVKFNATFTFTRSINKTTWTETLEGFEVDYDQEVESDIELVDGQEDLYTQPGLYSQYYEFNLNQTTIPENCGIGAEVINGEHSDSIKYVVYGPEARIPETYYQEGNKIFVWFRLVQNGDLQENDWAKFHIRLYCFNKTTKSVVWEKSFEDKELKLSYLGKEVAVSKTELNGTKADHDAGSTSRTYKLFHDPLLSSEWMPVPGKDPEELQISTIKEGCGIKKVESWECTDEGGEEAGMPYWNLTINFDDASAKEDDQPFIFNVLMQKTIDGNRTIAVNLGNFSFYYIDQKIKIWEEGPQTQKTPAKYNYGIFNGTLEDETTLGSGDYIRFDLTPVDPKNNVYARYYYQNVKLVGKDINAYIELAKTGGVLDPWDTANFNVTYVCYNEDGEKKWSQTLRGTDGLAVRHTLIKFVTPIKIDSDKLQYGYSNTEGKWGADYYFSLTTRKTTDEKISVQLEPTGASEGIELDAKPTVEIGEDNKAKFRATFTNSSDLTPGKFVEFKAHFTCENSAIPEHDWEYTIDNLRLEVGPGLTLDQATTIRWSAKEYKQAALKSAETIGEDRKVPVGTTTTVTVHTNDWPETELPSIYHWVLAMPRNPDKDLFDCYKFNVQSIVCERADGTEKQLKEGKEDGDYYVGGSGWINIHNRLGLQLGDSLVYTLTLINEDITTPTNFYWTIENSY